MPRPVVPILLAPPSAPLVQGDVVGQDDVGLVGNEQPAGQVKAAVAQIFQFPEEDLQVEHHAGAHHQEAAGVQGAAGNLVQGDALAVHHHVWPALLPPWKRTTCRKRALRRSTSLPLPSSPHCRPRMARFVARPTS